MMTIDKLKEKYLSTVLALGFALMNCKFHLSSKIDMESFSDKAIDISSISFGFLLAVLALLLQSDTPSIQRIKQGGRFNELINFNKKAVVASALLAIIALLYLSFKVAIIHSSIYICGISIHEFIDCVILAVFTFQVIEVYLFLDLFYTIIK
ncbi:hypothetical protein [Mucilaginibacter defluvii]|uniref:Cation efflux family protein n=1 Tax=Mucilaginibacter defluvii TaxID=1196019 RepID=A0ABP9G388_9SPHI